MLPSKPLWLRAPPQLGEPPPPPGLPPAGQRPRLPPVGPPGSPDRQLYRPLARKASSLQELLLGDQPPYGRVRWKKLRSSSKGRAPPWNAGGHRQSPYPLPQLLLPPVPERGVHVSPVGAALPRLPVLPSPRGQLLALLLRLLLRAQPRSPAGRPLALHRVLPPGMAQPE